MFKKRYLKLTFLFLCLSGKPIIAVVSDVNAYFFPQDKTTINKKLYEFLDSAKTEVFVASFFITDKRFIYKLIDLKNRGVKVYVIFDSLTYKRTTLIETFLNAGIAPIVSYSKFLKRGIMHNKFLVCDDNVWTGSANYTTKVFTEGKSFENVVFISSPQIAQQYKANFFEVEKKISQTYANLLSGKLKKKVPRWLFSLICELYKRNRRFNAFLRTQLSREKLQLFLQLPPFNPNATCPSSEKSLGIKFEEPLSATESEEPLSDMETEPSEEQTTPPEEATPIQGIQPASQSQKELLLERGIDASAMTYDQACTEIEEILQQQRGRKRQREIQQEKEVEPPCQKRARHD